MLATPESRCVGVASTNQTKTPPPQQQHVVAVVYTSTMPSSPKKERKKSALIDHMSALKSLLGKDKVDKRPRSPSKSNASSEIIVIQSPEEMQKEREKNALGRLSPLGGQKSAGYRNGDLFSTRGDYIEGLVYKSRGLGNKQTINALKQGAKGISRLAKLARGSLPTSNVGVVKKEKEAESAGDFIEVCWKTVFRAKIKAQKSDLHSLQEAAGALRNIVDNPELHPLLLKDGIINGIKALLERTRDPQVVRSCSDALCTLAHNTKIQALLVDEGLIEMLIYFMRGSAHLKNLAPRGAHLDILCNCAQSFLAISANAGPLQTQLQVSAPIESRLVREGPLSELQHLQSKDSTIRWALLKMIFNLAALGDHLPCLWLEDIIRIAMDTLHSSVKMVLKNQRYEKAGRTRTPTTTVNDKDTDENGHGNEFYAVILLMQTLSRLARINGVTQALLVKDIIHEISAVVSLSYACIMTKPSNQIPSLDTKKLQSVELLELSCILLYYLSSTVKTAPRMIEAQCPVVLRDLWAKLLEIRSSPYAAQLKFAAASMELTTITVAVLGNLARNPFARNTLIEKGLTAELAVLAQEHTVHLQMRRSGIEAIVEQNNGKTDDHEQIDPVLSEKLLATAVAALQEIACDDKSAQTIATQGALRMLNVVATYASDIALRAKAIVTICNMLSTGELETLLLQVEDDTIAAVDVLVLLHQEIVDYDLTKAGFIATAFHNLSCTASGKQIMQKVGDGILHAVTWIARQMENHPQTSLADNIVVLCAGIIFNLSGEAATARMLMHRKWIRSVIDIMKQSQMSRVDELAIATLHNLSKGYEKAGRVYAGEGALEELIELANNDDEPNAQELALTTLCILTEESENVNAMVRRGLIKALVTASRSHRLAETATIGLNNLAAFDHGHLVGRLIEKGAVDILIDHVSNQDPAIRSYSVIAVCHLACCCSTTLKPELGNHCLEMMIRHGAVQALLLAGFVRSSADSKSTQEACCKGLYALLASTAQNGSTQQLVTWQVVRAAVEMLEYGNEIRDIATILLVNISAEDEGRTLFTGMGFDALNEVALSKCAVPPTLAVRKRIVKILHNMLHKMDPITIPKPGTDSDDETEIDFNYFSGADAKNETNGGGTGEKGHGGEEKISEVYLDPNSVEAMEVREQEAKALALRCKRVTNANGVPTLMSLSRIEDPDCRLMCAVALSTIANNESTHAQFVSNGGFRAMTEMAHYDSTDVGTSACWSIRLCCIRSAAYAARVSNSRLRCVIDGACEMLVQAVQSTVFNEDIKHLCCQTIELFSREKKSRPFMAQQGIVEALDHLLSMSSAGNQDSEATLFARTVRNLSYSDSATEDLLVEYGVVHLFHSFAAFKIESVATDCAIAICNVFQKTSHPDALIHDGALSVIQAILTNGGKDPFSNSAEEIRESCSACLLSMAIQEKSREFLLHEGIFQTIHQICTEGNPTDATIDACCRALCVFCLDPDIRPIVVKIQAHKQVVGLHTIFARLSKRRHGARGVLQISQSRLALALLNLARVGATETQSDIIQHCDASALLEQASSLTDRERDDVNEPVIIDVRSNRYATDLPDRDHVDAIPEIYSFVRNEPWLQYHFSTSLLKASGMESHVKPEFAPRWKVDNTATEDSEHSPRKSGGGQKSGKSETHSKGSKGKESAFKDDGDSERRKQNNPIHVESIMMDRLLERLNCSYGSTVESLRYSVPSKPGNDLMSDSSYISSEWTDSVISENSEMLQAVTDSDIESIITGSLMDSSLIMFDSIAEEDENEEVGTIGKGTSAPMTAAAASSSQLVPKIIELLGEEEESMNNDSHEKKEQAEQQDKELQDQMIVLFHILDTDKTNYIDKMELLEGILYRADIVEIMRNHRKLKLLLEPGTFEASFNALDSEKDGHITMEELMNFVVVHHRRRSSAMLQTTFTSNHTAPPETPELSEPEPVLPTKTNAKTTERPAPMPSPMPSLIPPLPNVEALMNNKAVSVSDSSSAQSKMALRSGQVYTPADQHQRKTANNFLAAMRARSMESANANQRHLITGLCDSLAMLVPPRDTTMTAHVDLRDSTESSAFSQPTSLSQGQPKKQRFPTIKNASPRQTGPASPKMSRISFSR